MIVPPGAILLATVCNTTPNAVPYTLWIARGSEQYLVDLSDVLGQPGDGGLTGLACLGDRIYAAVQSGGDPRILILDQRLVPIGAIRSPELKDIHSIHAAGDALLVCSTGAQTVLRIDLTDQSTTELCRFAANVHLNSACFAGTELLVCCHYPGHVIPAAVGGGIIAPTDRRVVLAGLDQPHSLLPYRGGLLVLDSDGRRLIHFDHTGGLRQQSLAGFLRGVAGTDTALFVASSAGRVISRKNPLVPPGRQFWAAVAEPVRIYELDAESLAVKAEHFPLVAGFELYELLVIEPAWPLDPLPERLIVPDPNALSRVYYEACKWALAVSHQRQ